MLCGLYLYHDNTVVCEDNIIDFGFSLLVCHIDIAEVPEEGTVDKGQRMGNLIFCTLAGHMDCNFLFNCLQTTDTGNEIGGCSSTIFLAALETAAITSSSLAVSSSRISWLAKC